MPKYGSSVTTGLFSSSSSGLTKLICFGSLIVKNITIEKKMPGIPQIIKTQRHPANFSSPFNIIIMIIIAEI